MFLVVAGLAPPGARAAVPSVEELRRLSIEDLGNVEVTSVFKRPVALSKTPASVYVITRDDIRRSGARTLPEALRLAPNLMVARQSSREYAISARGFNHFNLSNKLLVMVDGRSIYTPLHAGVLWDETQVMLEDVDRIEVISGPGGTLWGANAVNGVINVITRDAHETQGGLAVAQPGNVDSRGAGRYGTRFGKTGAWRAYGQVLGMGETASSNGTSRNDDWLARQGGFRADWQAGVNDFTVSGDVLDNRYDPDASNSGGNLLGRWHHRLKEDSDVTVQAYYTHMVREQPSLMDQLDTVDIDARHTLRLGDSHQVVWGGGYRYYREVFDLDGNLFMIYPVDGAIGVGNVFVQDSIGLTQDVELTLGIKYEHSTYSGGEFLPSARVSWQFARSHMLWGAVSRAVRTPSRIDRELEGAGILEEAGGTFDVEQLIAYEIGYRGQPDDRSNLSVTVYYHDYEDLRVLSAAPSGVLRFANDQDGHAYGLESWGDYRVTDRWRLMAGVNLFRKSLELGPNARTTAIVQHQGDDPEYQLFLRSFYDISDDIELSALVRKIGRLPLQSIPAYTAVDVRLGWQAAKGLELSLVGMNLLDSQHPETGTTSEIRRSVYVGATMRF